MASKLLDGRRVLVGSEADPDSDRYMKASGGKRVTLADGTTLSAKGSRDYAKTPTVFTNTGIMEQRIPEMNAKVSQLPVYSAPVQQDPGDKEVDVDEMLGFKKSESQAPEEQDPYTASMFQLLDQMKQTSDQATRDQISLIENQANRLRGKQIQANAGNVAGVRNILQRGGGFRTSSGFGAVQSTENAGIEKLADIDAQERDAVAQARAAQQNGDYQLLEKQLGILENIRNEKAGVSGDVISAQQQAIRDTAMAELVAQGITDPIELLQTLNANGGDYTLDEITKSLKGLNEIRTSLPGGAFKLDNKGIGQLLGAGFTSNDITNIQSDLNSGASINDILAGFDPSMHGTVRQVLGVPEGAGAELTPGAGAATGDDEFVIRTRMFPKFAAILNKGTLSDEDRKIIDNAISQFRSMGLTEQQAVDKIWGFPTDSPYNSMFQDAILAGSEDGEDVSFATTKVANQLAKGSYIPAMNEVENTAMGRAQKLSGDSYFGKVPAEVYTTRIDRIKQLLEEGGVVGFVEGNFERVLGRLKGQKATQLRGELRQLYQTFRKENMGTAATESEQRYLEPLFADIQDTEGNFLAKLDTFQTGILDQYNATRSSVSLPKVRVVDILDPAERLKLYVAAPTFDGTKPPSL